MKLIPKQFLTKTFLTFCFIGIINTIIHLLIFNLTLHFLKQFDSFIYLYKEVIANTIAFIIASLFSYWANARITYHKKINHYSFWLSMLTFIIKLLLSNLLVLFFKFILITFALEEWIFLIPIPITCILLPLQFIMFNFIFKHN